MALLWANTVSYYVVLNADFDLIELCDMEDGESEKEGKEHENDKDDKIQSLLYRNNSISNADLISLMQFFNFLSSHHQEIQTPPPEFFLS